MYLPVEILRLILSCLSNCDVRNLRLTCSTLGQRAHLRLNRVFVSANRCNIEVCCAIADHETFWHNIAEVIWGDARLIENVPKQEFEFSDDEEDWEDNTGSSDGSSSVVQGRLRKTTSRFGRFGKNSHKTEP